MSESMSPPLYRHAGPIALVAGGLFAAADLGRFALMDLDDRIAMLADPLFRVFNAAYFFAFCGLMIGLVAVYGRQAREAGRFGVVGFCAAVVGTMTMGGDMWFDGFASPWLAEVLPQAFTAEKTVILQLGALSSYLLFALGWVLFGLAGLRARVFPAAISLAVVAAGVLGWSAGLPPYGVPIGLAVAALGGWLVRADRIARGPSEPSPAEHRHD
jgi:hypothetical protein